MLSRNIHVVTNQTAYSVRRAPISVSARVTSSEIFRRKFPNPFSRNFLQIIAASFAPAIR
jgi:hypothetical protein